jgi:hypothetical protein
LGADSSPTYVENSAFKEAIEEARVQLSQHTIIERGRLGHRFTSAFPSATLEPGHGNTRLQTEPLDQSQLHGHLEQLRNFVLELISVQETTSAGSVEEHQPTDPPNTAFVRTTAEQDEVGRS